MPSLPTDRGPAHEEPPLKKRGKKDGSASRGREPERAPAESTPVLFDCSCTRHLFAAGVGDRIERNPTCREHGDPPAVDRPVKRRPMPTNADPTGRFGEIPGTVAFVQRRARMWIELGVDADDSRVALNEAQVMRELLAAGYRG